MGSSYLDLPARLRVTFDEAGNAETYFPVVEDCDGIDLPLRGGFVSWLGYDGQKVIADLLMRAEDGDPAETTALEFYADRENYKIARSECEVCGNAIDAEGIIDHGKGCYTQSAQGGGSSFEGSVVALDEGANARAALKAIGGERKPVGWSPPEPVTEHPHDTEQRRAQIAGEDVSPPEVRGSGEPTEKS
jgi:hypothetical protein